MQQAKIPREDIQQALERALGKEKPPTLLEEIFEWISRKLRLPSLDVPWGEFLGWGVAITLVVFLIWFLVLLVRTSRLRARSAEEEELVQGVPLEVRLGELLAQAAAARAGGDLRLALRTYLFALVLGLGRRGDLVYRDAWTNRELLARGRPSRAVRELLEPLVRELEPKEFGSEEVSAEDVVRLENLVTEHLGQVKESAA